MFDVSGGAALDVDVWWPTRCCKQPTGPFEWNTGFVIQAFCSVQLLREYWLAIEEWLGLLVLPLCGFIWQAVSANGQGLRRSKMAFPQVRARLMAWKWGKEFLPLCLSMDCMLFSGCTDNLTSTGHVSPPTVSYTWRVALQIAVYTLTSISNPHNCRHVCIPAE